MNITLDDPRLTAYALDELDEAGRNVIEGEIQNFSECRREVEEMTGAAALLRAGLASEPMPALSPAQQRTIESKLSQARAKLSWIPSTKNWLLKTAIAAATALLICLIRIPVAVQPVLRIVQHASFETAYAMMQAAGVSVIKDESSLMVMDSAGTRILAFSNAAACYPISWGSILLVTSLLLGNFYLRSPWKRLSFSLFVIPLVIAKDSLRIFTIGELCVHSSVNTVIDSPLFHWSGSIFFALSLVPFFFFLVWLRKLESKS